MKNILFLVSGGGGNLKFFYLLKKLKWINPEINLYCIASRECPATHFSISNGIHTTIIKYNLNTNKELLSALERISPDIVITTWNKIIDKDVLAAYNKKFINLHYSLLPAFKGLIGIEPIRKAYNYNCKFIGSTTHYVEEKVDEGEIISQFVIPVSQNFNHDVERIFKGSCILLLHSIDILSNDSILNLPRYQSSIFNYSPALNFDITYFNDEFWNEFNHLK